MDPTWASAEHLDRVTDALRERLPAKRYLHSLGVAHAAVALAWRCGADPTAALAAGLLHDVAKKNGSERHRALLENDPEERDFPGLWHAVAGAMVACEDFGVDDEDVLRSIRIHPTGDAEMTALEQAVFLADYTEPLRDYDGVRDLRRLAREDMGRAVDEAIVRKTEYVEKSGKTMHPRSRRALEAARVRLQSK